MSMTATQFAQLIAKFAGVAELKAYFEGIRNSIDAKVLAKENEVDAFISGARNTLIKPRSRLHFDASTLITPNTHPWVLDSDDGSRTEWLEIEAIGHDVFNPLVNGVATSNDPAYTHLVHMQVATSTSSGGAYVKFDLVLALVNSTSDQINQSIEDNNFSIDGNGAWNNGTRSIEVKSLGTGYCTLFARLRSTDGVSNPLTGGIMQFAISEVEVYNKGV